MIRDEVEEARSIAGAEAIDEIRRDSAQLPSDDLAALLSYVEDVFPTGHTDSGP